MSLEKTQARVESGIRALEAQDIYVPSNVDVHFHFSAHRNADDLGDPEHLKSLFADADIVLFERSGWTPDMLAFYKSVAAGISGSLEATLSTLRYESPYNLALVEALYGSGKSVLFADVPENDPLHTAMHSLMKIHTARSLVDSPSCDDFNDSVEAAVQAQEEFATGQLYRERYMLTTFGRRVDQTIQASQELKKLDRVKVVWFVGSLHTSLFHELRSVAEAEQQISRTFGSGLPHFPAGQLIQRTRLLGTELGAEDKREAVISGFLRTIIRESLSTLPEAAELDLGDYETERLISRVATAFTEGDIRKYFELDPKKQVKPIKAFQGKIKKRAKKLLA